MERRSHLAVFRLEGSTLGQHNKTRATECTSLGNFKTKQTKRKSKTLPEKEENAGNIPTNGKQNNIRFMNSNVFGMQRRLL